MEPPLAGRARALRKLLVPELEGSFARAGYELANERLLGCQNLVGLAERDDAALVDHGHVVGEVLGDLHVMRRDQNRGIRVLLSVTDDVGEQRETNVVEPGIE